MEELISALGGKQDTYDKYTQYLPSSSSLIRDIKRGMRPTPLTTESAIADIAQQLLARATEMRAYDLV